MVFLASSVESLHEAAVGANLVFALNEGRHKVCPYVETIGSGRACVQETACRGGVIPPVYL